MEREREREREKERYKEEKKLVLDFTIPNMFQIQQIKTN